MCLDKVFSAAYAKQIIAKKRNTMTAYKVVRRSGNSNVYPLYTYARRRRFRPGVNKIPRKEHGQVILCMLAQEYKKGFHFYFDKKVAERSIRGMLYCKVIRCSIKKEHVVAVGRQWTAGWQDVLVGVCTEFVYKE